MYTRFFGLNEKPFSITPDPRYLYMSERHGEALAHLVYGVTESGGFIQLTGEVGTGKTTLVRTLLLNRMPQNANVAVVLNPQISAHEFLATICEELGIAVPKDKTSIKALTDALNHHLLDAHSDGRRTILVVDEAQNLAPAVLEQVRLLTNLETAKQKLLQIILIGQPELRELLGRNDLRQLAQRITGRYHLEPLTRDETAQYIEHRLSVAGALGEVFDSGAKKEVYRLSQGVPRLINVICDRALLGAYSQEARHVNRRLVRRAAAEVSGELERSPYAHRLAVAAAVVVISASAWIVIQNQDLLRSQSATVAAPAASAAAAAADGLAEEEPQPLMTVAIEEPEPQQEVDDASLAEQLALANELTKIDPALTTLFELWGLEYVSGGRNGCLQAAEAGLACLYQRGSWNGLRQLDRPSILTVIDDAGTRHEVVLTAIQGDRADLSIGGVKITHSVAEISDVWFGQHMLLWRPPNGAPVSLSTGSRGPDVIWLRESLAEIDSRYRTDNMESAVFDADLDKAVRQFQREHRLNVDGHAGQQTQIIINSFLAAEGTPRLATPQLARE